MTPEARAARERKQKIFVVVGGLLLLAMLAFQLPKLLGGSSSPEATADHDRRRAGRSWPARGDRRCSGRPRRLDLLGLGQAHLVLRLRGEGSVRPAGRDRERARRCPPKAKPRHGGGSTAKAAGSTTKFATGKTAAAAVTIVTVNGARQVLEPGMKFPTGDPLFVLVAEKPGSKSVVVGIVGGAYSGGAKTTTLKAGKPITLVNTTTGARYKISLVSVGSGDSGAEAAQKP